MGPPPSPLSLPCRHFRHCRLSLNPPPPSHPLPPYESYWSHHPNVRRQRFLFPRIEAYIDLKVSSPITALSSRYCSITLSLSVLKHLRRWTLQNNMGRKNAHYVHPVLSVNVNDLLYLVLVGVVDRMSTLSFFNMWYWEERVDILSTTPTKTR